MQISKIEVERVSVTSSRSFAQVLASLEAAIGHPDMHEFGSKVGAAKSWQELERVIQGFIGSSGFMEFTRFNIGLILSKEQGPDAPEIVRLVLGNPLIMKQMAKHV